MKILILDGNPDPENGQYQTFLEELERSLVAKQHELAITTLREKEIGFCTGCWGCWVKTPGECVIDDYSREVCRDVINSDLVIFLSPVILGFTSALLKKTQDRLIPLIHPHIVMVNGESHHKKRYPFYPKLGLVIERDGETDDEDLRIIEDIYRRFALNFKTELSFMKTTGDPVEEIVDEIGHL
jgi:multimeric flavodoxin WrbA